jgi:MFS family permease
MQDLFKKYYLPIIFSLLVIFYSSFNKIGPWDEYHLLYYFKNKLFFPFYDSNFIYYDTYSLGRFSPLAGQEFNIPIFLGLDINYSFFLVATIILLTIAIYFYILGNFYNYFDKKIFVLFILFILSSPSFYIISTRLLYAEDTSALLIFFFLCSFLKCINLEKFNNKFFWNVLLVLTTFLSLLYKENNFVILSSFVISYFFFHNKKINKNKLIIIFILSFSLIYLLILLYINLIYKNNDLAYVQNLNWNFLTNALVTLIRFGIFNDPILFLILIPVALFSFNKSKNIFFKAIFVSGIMNILFFIFLGLYGPYYLYISYFLVFPLFYEGLVNFSKLINFKKKLGTLFIIFVVCISFINSIFYYFESKNFSTTFNSTVKYLEKNIKNQNQVTKIFVCNNLSEGMLAHIYILGEHIKYNDIEVSQFQFYSLTKNTTNVLNSKLSPFDKNEYNYNNSIFQNKFKNSVLQKNDLLINIYSYSSSNSDNCSYLIDKQYAKVFSNTKSFFNTLTSNFAKVIFLDKNFNKDYFIKKLGYDIFQVK